MSLRLKFVAAVIAWLWAGFWFVFIALESIVTHTPMSMAMGWMGVGLFFLLLAWLPSRWERVGGTLLILVGVFSGLVYAVRPPPDLSLATIALTALTFALPPVVSGTLFLLCGRQSP